MSAVYIGPMVTSASTEAPEVIDFEPTAEQIEYQVDLLIDCNEEAFYEWDAHVTADTEREHSAYFGRISNLELRQIQYSVYATPEQVKAACMELRRRFTDDNLELITERAEKAAAYNDKWGY